MKEFLRRIINIFWKVPKDLLPIESPSEEQNYFDEEKRAKAFKWIEEKWPKEKKVCEICDSKSFALAVDLVMPLRFIGGRLIGGGNTYPHILIICNGCGNTKFFNAVVAGIVDSEPININK